MRPMTTSLIALIAACESFGPGGDVERYVQHRYATGDGTTAHGSLNVSSDERHLSGVLSLADGSCVTEEAMTELDGRLRHADVWISQPSAAETVHAMLDAEHGTVAIKTPSLDIHWNVPNDLPWIWQPCLRKRGEQAGVATPLSVLVARGGARADRAVRSIDLQTLQHASVMSDQIMVGDDSALEVVLGDDAADVADGVPQRIHSAALRTNLTRIDASQGETLAALSCGLH
jgi:hypothetical protein